MRQSIAAGLAMLLTAGAPAERAVEPAQAALDQLAATLGYRFAVVSNKPVCPGPIKNCFLATLTITTPAKIAQPLPAKGLAIYFSFVNRVSLVESDMFDHQLINGDLQRLTLKPGKTLEPNKIYVVKLWGTGTQFSKSHAMPNAYLVADAVQARTIASTRPAIDPDTRLETLPFVAPMTDETVIITTISCGSAASSRASSPSPSAASVAPRAKLASSSNTSGCRCASSATASSGRDSVTTSRNRPRSSSRAATRISSSSSTTTASSNSTPLVI
ncbi:MAG: hypothetical protein EOP89_13190 [Lysobacteraceae bacterium]|nr:MAG: hypothetical protein EOP89_13190 [Xanthomonadaceae bacterium]